MFRVRDLTDALRDREPVGVWLAVPPGAVPRLGDAEVITQIEEERANLAAAGRQRPLPIPPQLMLSRTLGGGTTGPAPNDLLGYAPATDTPLSAARLSHMEDGIEEASTRATALELSVAGKQNADADLTAIAGLSGATMRIPQSKATWDPTTKTWVSNVTPEMTAQAQAINRKYGMSLDADDFMKLLVAQMRFQDPSKPADTTAIPAGEMVAIRKLDEEF